jgi:hypothetical protein
VISPASVSGRAIAIGAVAIAPISTRNAEGG